MAIHYFLLCDLVLVNLFTQLLGMALGLKPRKVGVHENISDSIRFLREKGIA